MIRNRSNFNLLLLRIVLLLFVFFLCRVFFLVFNAGYFSSLDGTSVMLAFIYGLRFDITALVIANLTGRWSNHFFSAEAVPPELSAAMVSFRFQPGPELRYSNMPPAPLEFGFDEIETPHARKQGLKFLTRAACSWLVVVGLIGVAWAASH